MERDFSMNRGFVGPVHMTTFPMNVPPAGGAGTVSPEVSTSPSSPGPDTPSPECPDLNLVPPPRPSKTHYGSIAMAACFFFVVIASPLTAVYVTHKRAQIVSHVEPLCNDSVCHMEAHYYDDKLDENVDPCEDYYGYVCSSAWYTRDLRSASYLIQTSGYLYQALKKFSAEYMKQDVNRVQQNRHQFGHQIILFISNCVKESAKDRHETEALTSVLRYFGLANWPYSAPLRSRQNVAFIAGKVAGALEIFPFIETRLRLVPGDRPKVLFGQAQLTLAVHELLDQGRAMDWYRELVTRAVRLVRSSEGTVGIVDGILRVERGLAYSVENGPRRDSLFKVRLNSLPVHRSWDWVAYVNGVLKGISAINGHEEVFVRSVSFLQRLSQLTREVPPEALLNYLGYRVLVALSPLIPADFLAPLAVKGRRWPGSEHLQSCVQLAESVFDKAMTLVIKRASPFLNGTDTKQKLWGLLSSMNSTLVHLINETRWMTPVDKNVTIEKLASVSVSLLDTYESEHDLNQYLGEVPMVNERSLVESYFHMKVSVQRKYWSALHKNLSLLMHHGIGNFNPEYSYEPQSNTLFLPFGVVGFLMYSNDILPMHVPRFLPYALRGFFSAIANLQAVHNDDLSWTKTTSVNFAHMAWCFLRQYNQVLSNEMDNAVVANEFLEEIVQDNAILEPLYRVYVNSFPVYRGKSTGFTLPTLKTLTSDELFFLNYAIGHCEDVRNDTMVRQLVLKERIPARYKVNLPLSNYRRFAAVYGCKTGSRMNPDKSCSVWGLNG
ncbi:neprilysin-1-like [Ornithodoros turicata]|uniref:neprilysin-1-like n=1 Tax=Ornithodoros turicata TaxID=34597 RepID=UPI0031399066